MNSMNTMTKAMGTAAQTMKTVDKQMPLEKFAADMREFQQTNEKMDMKEEMINDTLDSMFEVDEGEEQAVIDQVLDEIGIEVAGKVSSLMYRNRDSKLKLQLPNAPMGATGLKTANKEVTDADIERMLAQLRE